MREVPVFLWEMTRREFLEGVDRGNAGSTEQHNEHSGWGF